jgi:hypothetical protein
VKDSTRARIAATVGATTKEKRISSVFDYADGRYHNASVKVSGGKVSGFDYSTNSHFAGGSRVDGKLDFFDYENSAHVQLRMNGKSFKGFDYHTSSHFTGRVSGRSISMYDYGTGRHYNYSV